jgi:MoxR-like ATPase
MKIAAVAERVREVVQALGRIVVGKDEVLERILAGILANGHVLVEDYPGLAKTLIARLLAQALDLGFRRIQFTPDLLPSDITGSFLYDQRESRFEFRPGPVFANLLLADEINRATPKTQAALLEAMQEFQVTLEGQSFPLPQPFVVIATQNPIELEGTYPLPEAQLDRFLLRVGVGYPDAGAEREMLRIRRARRTDAVTVPVLVPRAELVAMQAALEDVFVSEALERYIVALAQATRTDPRVALGVSPRGSLAVLKLARAEAAIRGREFMLPDDVKAVAVAALAHRVILKSELWVARTTPAQVVESLLQQVPAPAGDTG